MFLGYFDLTYSALLIVAAVLPAAVIGVYIYKKDGVEHEPIGLLIALLIGGVAAAGLASIFESFGNNILNMLFTKGSIVYYVALAILVGLSEEGAKLIMLRRISWNRKAFNYRFDAVVYGAMVSLGFAAFENVFYVLEGGFRTALARALLSVPGHVCWGIIAGFFYAEAKEASLAGDKEAEKRHMLEALLVPAFLHAFYDACAFIGSGPLISVLYVFSAGVDKAVIGQINSSSKEDNVLHGLEGSFAAGDTLMTSARSPQATQVPPAQESVHYCSNCGAPNPVSHAFCSNCGAQIMR